MSEQTVSSMSRPCFDGQQHTCIDYDIGGMFHIIFCIKRCGLVFFRLFYPGGVDKVIVTPNAPMPFVDYKVYGEIVGAGEVKHEEASGGDVPGRDGADSTLLT